MSDLDFKVSGRKGYVLLTVDDSKHVKVAFENAIHVEVVFNLLVDAKRDSHWENQSDSCLTQNNEDVSRKMAKKILALLGEGDDPGLKGVISDDIDACVRFSSVDAHTDRVTKSTKNSKKPRKKQQRRQPQTSSRSNSNRAQWGPTVSDLLSPSFEPECGDQKGESVDQNDDDDINLCGSVDEQTPETDALAKSVSAVAEMTEQTLEDDNQEVPNDSKITKSKDTQDTPNGEFRSTALDDNEGRPNEFISTKQDNDQGNPNVTESTQVDEGDYCKTSIETKSTEVKNHKEMLNEPKSKEQSGEVSLVADYYCVDCNKSFRRKASYVQHVRTHMMDDSDEDESKESDCDKKSDKSSKGSHYNPDSDSENYLQSEEDSDISVEEGWAYNCSSCGLGFPSLGSYNQHLTRDHGETQLYQCGFCDESFSLARLRDTHRRDAHGLVKEFICKFCSMKFDSIRSLFEHKRSTHMDKMKEYKCTFCDKTFQTWTELQRHKKLAKHGIYCEICRQTFQTIGLLNQHLHEEHLEDRDKEGNLLLKRCPHCLLLFFTDTALKRHKLHHDDNSRKWTCDHCQRRFHSYILLNKHIRDYHIHCDSDNQCPLCGKFYPKWKKHLQWCKKQRFYVCKTCQKNFRCRHQLQRHMLSHTKEKPFQCEVCAKCFSQSTNLNTHMRTHTKEKPFSCPFCDMKFGHKCSLQGHVERKHPVESLQQRMEHVRNGDRDTQEKKF